MNLPQFTTLPKFTTLTELIDFFASSEEINAPRQQHQFRIYEMGRQIIEISVEDFIRFEQTEIPWPTPLLQSAWFALIFSDQKHQQEHFWFLKFPLDEQGKLVQASRDEYIAQFLQQIGDKQNLEKSNQIESLNMESPYGFKPSEEKLANINAIYKAKEKLEPSSYFETVYNYFDKQHYSDKQHDFDKQEWNNWQNLGYQGIADYCSRLTDDLPNHKNLSDLLINAFTYLPEPVINSLSSCLEHQPLVKKIYSLWLKQLDHSKLESQVNTLKVIGLNNYSNKQAEYIEQCLKGPFRSNIEVLALVSGRNWEYLKESELMLLYLEALANNKDSEQNFFILLQDLMFIPGMREYVLTQFRNPKRSIELSQAIGKIYQAKQ